MGRGAPVGPARRSDGIYPCSCCCCCLLLPRRHRYSCRQQAKPCHPPTRSNSSLLQRTAPPGVGSTSTATGASARCLTPRRQLLRRVERPSPLRPIGGLSSRGVLTYRRRTGAHQAGQVHALPPTYVLYTTVAKPVIAISKT